MLGSGSIIMLHELQARGKSIRAIARETGHSRNTVRKYLRAEGIPERKPRPKRGSKLDPYKDTIQELMNLGIFNCEVIYERIKEEGYTGGRTILRDYVRQFRPPKQVPAVCRYETKPGQQAQVDWGEYTYIDEETGEIRKLYVFVMVLGYSRAIYVEFTNRCDVRTFIRCLIHGFEYFGGVTDIVLTDRMKTVILGTGENKKPIWNPTFEDLAATLGFISKVCRARRPQTKGKVESGIDFVKNNFLPGRKFVDYGDLNRQAIVWCEKKNRRIHGTTGERPIDRLKKENLKPLPALDKYQKFLEEARKVHKDGFLSFDGVRYGVPWQYSGKEVVVRDKNGKIEILYDGKVIAVHEKHYRSRSTVFLKDQYKGLKEAEGMFYPRPKAIKLSSLEVEKRPLGVYESLLEVGTV
ncbi:IS21-like element ISChy4 family transposase [Carboxydothermus hydrogenoformans]|uniref:ISChy4, transposase n=1 Tax=Carboxydothermus hydrogenoformans (strain ATCC BAA-161 / DSM 6008 / Z-2901) TaxID=246194 RepID=Q3AD21_CARHZ|nr:IS21-like element ISChy4 family transposase [Carboxydothermus hydrogenoformans]ABB14982.1 ISChy4, transposase [Carboxydothermus hydrogenoformans Z-2901]